MTINFGTDLKCCFITKIKRGEKLSSSMVLLNSTRFGLARARRACTTCNSYGHMTKGRLNTRPTMVEGCQVLDWQGEWTFVNISKKSLELLKLPLLKSLVAVSSFFCIHAACSLKLFVPTTNVFGTWRSNTKIPLECLLH